MVNEFVVLLCAFLMVAFLDNGQQRTGFATAIILLFSTTIIGSFVISIIFQVYMILVGRKRAKTEMVTKIEIQNASNMSLHNKGRDENTNRQEEVKEEGHVSRKDSLIFEDNNEDGRS